MKRCLLLIVVSGLLSSACSTFTCPTYTKAPEKEKKTEMAEERI